MSEIYYFLKRINFTTISFGVRVLTGSWRESRRPLPAVLGGGFADEPQKGKSEECRAISLAVGGLSGLLIRKRSP
jgi:hypothetical protein